MRTSVRTIALAIATVVVVGALVVLFVRVRSAPEIVVPEEALDQARARYQRTRAAGGARPSESSRSAAAPVASQPTSADESPAMERRRRRTGTLPSAGSPGASPAPASRPSGETIVPLNEVRTAYDTGDFESALELAEKRLRDHPEEDYVKRVAVVSACAMGEEAVARRHYNTLSVRDQPIVSKRCSRYGVQF